MNNVSVDWGSSIQWASFYRRNNKTGAIKNVQCFPNHFNGVHKDAGFCGQSILIKVICDKSIVSDIHVMGEFCLEENSTKRYPVGSQLTIEEYDSNKKSHTFFSGVLDKEEEENQLVKCTYEINRELRGWHYGWTASKHRQDIDHVFIIHVFHFNQGKYESVGILYSPPFQIRCSRRVTTLIESRNTPKAFKKIIPQPYNPNEKYNQFIPHNKDSNDNQECLYDGLNRDIRDEANTRYSIPLSHMNMNVMSLTPTLLPSSSSLLIKKENTFNTLNTSNTPNTPNTPNTGISNNVKKKLNKKRKIDKNNSLLVYASQNNHKKKIRVLKPPPPIISFTSLSQQSSPLESDHKMSLLDIKSEPPSPITLPPTAVEVDQSNNNNSNNKMTFQPDCFNNSFKRTTTTVALSPTMSFFTSNLNSPSSFATFFNNNNNNSKDEFIQPPPPPPLQYEEIQYQQQFQQQQYPTTLDHPPPPPPPPPPPISINNNNSNNGTTTPPPYLHSLHSPPPLSLLPSRSISPAIEPSLIYDGPVLSDQYADPHSFVPLPPPASPLLHSSSSLSSMTSSNSDENERESSTSFQSAFFGNNNNENNNENSENGNNNNNDFVDWNSFDLNGDYEESRFIFSPSSINSSHVEFFDSQFLQSTPPPTPTPVRPILSSPSILPIESSSSTKTTEKTPLKPSTSSSSSSSSPSFSSQLIQRKQHEEKKIIFNYFLFVFISTLCDTLIVVLLKRLLDYFDYKLKVLDKNNCLYLLVFMIIIGIVKRFLKK